ncbi:alcohol dehydrogenase Bli-4 [Apiospora rasikravindrae]|uniref:Alcohol dehydrogenase Bli-4 n=1 Tax=Apiospora rasikravindrae TaxID=990691 RepID=A0ABR1SF89_9PEZI
MAQLMEMMRVTLFGSRNDASGSKGAPSFDPSRDIASLAGKVVLVTGAAGDLGRTTAVQLARYGRPARIYVADLPRDGPEEDKILRRIEHEAYGTGDAEAESKSGKAGGGGGGDDDNATRTEFRYLSLDLGSLKSVRACAAGFIAREERLDILILNAGIIRVAPGTTADGYEAHFGINYLGHALLARLLVPTLVRTAEQSDARVVVVSSEGHTMAPKGGIQFDALKGTCAEMSYGQRYGQSKVALIGLAKQLGSRYPQLKVAAVHPGRILTGMAESLRKESLIVRITAPIAPLVCVPVATGVKNHLWAATSPDVVSGKYYEPVGIPNKESAVAKDDGLSDRLWEWTEKELSL